MKEVCMNDIYKMSFTKIGKDYYILDENGNISLDEICDEIKNLKNATGDEIILEIPRGDETSLQFGFFKNDTQIVFTLSQETYKVGTTTRFGTDCGKYIFDEEMMEDDNTLPSFICSAVRLDVKVIDICWSRFDDNNDLIPMEKCLERDLEEEKYEPNYSRLRMYLKECEKYLETGHFTISSNTPYKVGRYLKEDYDAIPDGLKPEWCSMEQIKALTREMKAREKEERE